MNIFIAEINQMDESSWAFAESVYGEDRIMFIPDDEGNIPYFTVKKINSLSVNPEFLPIHMSNGISQIVFSLALACCDVDNATVYICSSNPAFEQLNDTEFETREGGKINIIVCDGMDCITYNDGDSEISTDNNEDEEIPIGGNSLGIYQVPDITIPDPDEMPPEEPELQSSSKSSESLVEDNEDSKDSGKPTTESDSSALSIQLLNTMKRLDKTGILTKHAKTVVDAMKENEDGSIMTLNFIMHDKVDDDSVADAIMNVLGEDNVIDQLTKVI